MSQESPRFRAVLDNFAPYQPGRRVSAPDGRSYKLSSNESPFGPLPSVPHVIARGRPGRQPLPGQRRAG